MNNFYLLTMKFINQTGNRQKDNQSMIRGGEIFR
jgi:hypothetical protein